MLKSKIQYTINLLFSNLIYKRNSIRRQGNNLRDIYKIDNLSLLDTSFNQKISQEIIDIINNLQSELSIPSIQVSIYTKKHGNFNFVSGFANLETNQIATLDTVYYLGSITKIYV